MDGLSPTLVFEKHKAETEWLSACCLFSVGKEVLSTGRTAKLKGNSLARSLRLDPQYSSSNCFPQMFPAKRLIIVASQAPNLSAHELCRFFVFGPKLYA